MGERERGHCLEHRTYALWAIRGSSQSGHAALGPRTLAPLEYAALLYNRHVSRSLLPRELIPRIFHLGVQDRHSGLSLFLARSIHSSVDLSIDLKAQITVEFGDVQEHSGQHAGLFRPIL